MACTVQFHGGTAGVGISGSRCGGVRALARMHAIFVVARSFQNQINLCLMTLSLALCAAGDVALGDCQEVGGCHEPQSKQSFLYFFIQISNVAKHCLKTISRELRAAAVAAASAKTTFAAAFVAVEPRSPKKYYYFFHQIFK